MIWASIGVVVTFFYLLHIYDMGNPVEIKLNQGLLKAN